MMPDILRQKAMAKDGPIDYSSEAEAFSYAS